MDSTQLHDHTREDRADRRDRRPRAPSPARAGGPQRLTSQPTSRKVSGFASLIFFILSLPRLSSVSPDSVSICATPVQKEIGRGAADDQAAAIKLPQYEQMQGYK